MTPPPGALRALVASRGRPAAPQMSVCAGLRALCRELKPILLTYAGKQARYHYTREMGRNLLKGWPALWTFADHRGIEPTNNHAERALRGSVIYHKLSLGTQPDHGERRFERLPSVHTTYRPQHHPPHDYLTAHSRSDPTPPSPDQTGALNAYSFRDFGVGIVWRAFAGRFAAGLRFALAPAIATYAFAATGSPQGWCRVQCSLVHIAVARSAAWL